MELLYKDVKAFVFARARQFLEDFIDFLGAPKTFLGAASVYNSENLKRAFSFFLIVYVLANLLFVFAMPLGDGLSQFVIFNIAYTVVFAAFALLVLQLSWLIVGARPPLRRMLLSFLYFTGIAVIIQCALLVAVTMILAPLEETIALLDQLDTLSAQDPAAAETFLVANPGLELQVLSCMVAFAVYVLADVIWTIIVWGAFRELAGVGKLRSAIAMLIFYLLASLLFVFSLFFIEVFAPGVGGTMS